MSGRVCEKHQEWCPDGFCRWCAPEAAAAPSDRDLLARYPIGVAFRDGHPMTAAEVAASKLERPWLPLLEALTKPNPLLVDLPWQGGSRYAQPRSTSDVKCQCGRAYVSSGGGVSDGAGWHSTKECEVS